MIDIALCFDDVLLEPQYSNIQSREEVNLTSTLGEEITLSLPIISAPMNTVTGAKMSLAMSKSGGLGIIHRYCSISDQFEMVKRTIDNRIYLGFAVGATGDFLNRANSIADYILDTTGLVPVICIDVAHGHHANVKNAIEQLKKSIPQAHIMAGNIATAEAYFDLAKWGADSIRVGVGSGSVCTTRLKTGHGIPGLYSVIECKKARDSIRYPENKPAIIADGGICNSGDIVKAFAGGADAVMLGSLLAGTDEAPGDIILHGTTRKKEFMGMASTKAQKNYKGWSSHAEGISTTVPYKGPVNLVLEQLVEGIKSGLSYSGAENLEVLRSNARFIQQTSAGLQESKPHILGN